MLDRKRPILSWNKRPALAEGVGARLVESHPDELADGRLALSLLLTRKDTPTIEVGPDVGKHREGDDVRKQYTYRLFVGH